MHDIDTMHTHTDTTHHTLTTLSTVIFTLTYDIVTPESAEHGDVAERGYYMPAGYYFDLETMGEDDFMSVRQTTDPDPDYSGHTDTDTSLEAVVEVCRDGIVSVLREYGLSEVSGVGVDTVSVYGVDAWDVNYRTGAETSLAGHFRRPLTMDPSQWAEVWRYVSDRL